MTKVGRSDRRGRSGSCRASSLIEKLVGGCAYCDITPPLESSVHDGPVQKNFPSSQPYIGGGATVSFSRGCHGSDAKMEALIRFTAFGCFRWKALTLAFACVMLAAGSQELSPAPRPFHLTRCWSWHRYRQLSRILLTLYSSSPSTTAGAGGGGNSLLTLFLPQGARRSMWNTLWILSAAGNLSR